MNSKTETIAIFGANGQLGMDLRAALSGHGVEGLDLPELDVRNRYDVEATLVRIRPTWVINSAAFTDVDKCEDHDLAAFQVNALGARHIARACNALGARLIQISTDYVFDGKKSSPYLESDLTGPLNLYGKTKLAGERFALGAESGCIVVRTSGLYGSHPCLGKGRNFADTMLLLAADRDVLRIVDDEILTPTFTEDLARQIRVIIESAPSGGIYHATNSGECSWFDFARMIFDLAGVSIRLERTTAAQWNAPAKRPGYSVLDNNRLRSAGLDRMPRWEDALSRYIETKKTRGA